MIDGVSLAKTKIKFIEDLIQRADPSVNALVLILGDEINQELKRQNDVYKTFYNRLHHWRERASTIYQILNSSKEEELNPVDLATYLELEPWVRKIRKKYFGKTEPPFSPEAFVKEIIESPALRKTLGEILLSSTDTLTELLHYINMRDSNGDPMDVARSFAWLVSAYVFSGIRMPLPKFSLNLEFQRIKSIIASPFGDYRLDHPDSLSSKSIVTVQIWSSLSDADMKGLRRKVNSHFGSERTKVLSNKNSNLLYAVKGRGKPPQRGNSKRGAVKKFWESVSNELGYRDWRTTRRSYVRLIEKREVE